MQELGIGKIIEGEKHRDAIHVAVCPVVAAMRLVPGDRIGFIAVGDTVNVGNVERTVGIVDPFLGRCVEEGERFWMFLYPGSITSLRHEWTHPAFEENPDKAASEAWLRDAAIKLGVEYEDLVSDWSPLVSSDYINNGETIRDRWYEIHGEFWKHRKIVTGVDVAEDDRGGFTCSC